MKHKLTTPTQLHTHVHACVFEMFVADSLVSSGARCSDCICFVLTFETAPSSIGLEHVYIRHSVSRFEVHTQMCTLCNSAHQDLSLFSLSVSFLKFSFRFPTTYRGHTRTPATSHASGGITESILEEDWQWSSSEVQRTIYDCHHKFRTVKCLFLTVESESLERL